MALPLSGQLSFSQIIHEAGVQSSEAHLDNAELRFLANKTTPQSLIKFSDFYGKEKFSFTNGDFSLGSISNQNDSVIEIPGWVFHNKQVFLNGRSSILGYPTPNDNTNPVRATNGDNYTVTSGSFQSVLENVKPPQSTINARSARLISKSLRSSSYSVVHGPYLTTKSAVSLEAGDKVYFWWKAEGGDDAYDIFAYLLNVNNGNIIHLANDTGQDTSYIKPWTKVSATITSSQAGSYYFVFISGSYDFTGGTILGASLYVSMVEVERS